MPDRWRALLVLTIARLSLGFQVQSIPAIGPDLVAQISLSAADLGTLIGLYYAPGLLLAFPAGLLGQRLSDKRVVILSLLIMVLGGVVSAVATEPTGLMAARLLSGVGGVALNVVMTKMIADWFAEREEIVLAMAIYINAMPVGMGLAMIFLSWIALAANWNYALLATGAISLAAVLLVLFAYRKHPNDGPGRTAAGSWISLREVMLVSVAGIIWGIYNGAYNVMMGFAPIFLSAHGVSAATAALFVSIAIWLSAASIQAGGIVAQAATRWTGLVVIGTVAWAVFLILMTHSDLSAISVLGAGLVMGLPVGVMLALPTRALRPESRALGMGIFQTWLYIGTTFIPPAAGWTQEATGEVAAPLLVTALLVASLLPLYWIFQRSRRTL